jgi:hypothetical protein
MRVACPQATGYSCRVFTKKAKRLFLVLCYENSLFAFWQSAAARKNQPSLNQQYCTMPVPLPAVTLGVTINRDARDVYAYVANAAHFPQWAKGLCLSIEPTGTPGTWLATTPQGKVTVRCTPPNSFGITDHFVRPAGGGEEVYVPMRVLQNQNGATVQLTVFRLPGMEEAQFAQDQQAVQKDLDTLKQLLEIPAHGNASS